MSLETMAIGLGVDTHRFKEGGPLVLGGIEIPFDKSLDAHSDGDVLLHAILDAVLSAADQPDLGTLFPDTDEANRGRSSVEMATEVARRLNVAGARLLSLDAVVICEQPRIAPLRAQLRESVAAMFDIPVNRVNVKGKTAEGMGAMGRGEGIECRTVVLVERGESQ